MKHARVVYQGLIHEATERDGQLLLQDGRSVSCDAASWLPPLACVFCLKLRWTGAVC